MPEWGAPTWGRVRGDGRVFDLWQRPRGDLMAADRPAGMDLGQGQEVVSELDTDPSEAKRHLTEGHVDESARNVSIVEPDPVDLGTGHTS